MTIKQTPYLIAAILLPFIAAAQTATTTTTSGNQSSATVNATVAPNSAAPAPSGSNPAANAEGEKEEEEKGEEYVAENYDKSIEELTWHLIKEQLVEANNIKVEQEDVLKMARDTTKAQFAQYGMLSIPDDVLDNYAQEMLKKKETINNLVSRVVEVKLAAALKAQVTLENKNVSIEEFNKMFE